MSDSLINPKQRREMVPASEVTIWRWERAGSFPRRIKINGRNFWRLSEIQEWISKQAHAE